jgi:hypothetical protein
MRSNVVVMSPDETTYRRWRPVIALPLRSSADGSGNASRQGCYENPNGIAAISGESQLTWYEFSDRIACLAEGIRESRTSNEGKSLWKGCLGHRRGGGLGREFAHLFAKLGAKVVVNDLGSAVSGECLNKVAA